MPDDESPLRHGSPADDRVRVELAPPGRPRLAGAGFQHAEQAPEGLGHPLPWLAGAAKPADRQHQHQGEGEWQARTQPRALLRQGARHRQKTLDLLAVSGDSAVRSNTTSSILILI